MRLHTHRLTAMCWSTVLGLAAAALAQTTQPAATTRPASGSTGYIKGTNVYIRSGFSTNYYPVTKMNRGDEVRIDGEEFGWLKIVPPAGTYSLVEKSFVDRAGSTGVANGATWVLAGSNMDDRHYAKQIKLSKGQEVQIIGETGDFYKIESPAGAHLWIKADLVDRSGTALAQAGMPKTSGLETIKPGELKLAQASPPAAKSPTARMTPSKSTPRAGQKASAAPPPGGEDKYQLQIDAIEAEITAECAKPLGERVFDSIISKLQPIAEQSEDEAAQIYAKARLDHLREHKELAGAVQQLRGLRDDALVKADQIARERARLHADQPMIVDDIAVRGEIRVSGVYDGASNRPKRWRMVNPENNRTLAYLEVPQGSPIDPVQYYGKFVGIRASGHRILDVNPPVPIYTIKEIVLQDPAQTNAQSAAPVSPVPLIVAPPSTQPSAAEPVTDK